MPRVRLSKVAQTDLRGIREYIAQHNEVAAKRYSAKLRKKCLLLGKHPGLGERCDEISPGARRTFVGNYIIYYRHEGSVVEIIRIVRGDRDIQSL